MSYIIHMKGSGVDAYVSKVMEINNEKIRNIHAMYTGPGWTKMKSDAFLIENYPKAMTMFNELVDVMLKDYEYNKNTDELTRDKETVTFKYRSGLFLSSIVFTLEKV